MTNKNIVSFTSHYRPRLFQIWTSKTPAPSALPLRSRCVGLRGDFYGLHHLLSESIYHSKSRVLALLAQKPRSPANLRLSRKHYTVSAWACVTPYRSCAASSAGLVAFLLCILGPREDLLTSNFLCPSLQLESLRYDLRSSTCSVRRIWSLDSLCVSFQMTLKPSFIVLSLRNQQQRLDLQSTAKIRSPIND